MYSSASADFFFLFSYFLAPPVGASPIFTVNAEPETILTVDGIESLNTYANGAAMIGLRISGNLRGKFLLFRQIWYRFKLSISNKNNLKN